jgi:hypothetical protein
VTAGEEEQADLMMNGEEQGTLLALLGSDSDTLARGNTALETVLDKYPNSAMAQYVKLVRGVNASRDFKTIRPAIVADDMNRMNIRRRNESLAASMLGAVSQGNVIDSITRAQAASCLATGSMMINTAASSANASSVRKLSGAVREKEKEREKVGAAR